MQSPNRPTKPLDLPARTVSRRTVTTAAAWAAPVIVASVATPAFASSAPTGRITVTGAPTEPVWEGSTITITGQVVRDGGPLPSTVFTLVSGENAELYHDIIPSTIPVDNSGGFTLTITVPHAAALTVLFGAEDIDPTAGVTVHVQKLALVPTPKRAVMTGEYAHSMAISSDGTLYTWGQNHSGVLGNGTTTGPVTSPTAIMTETQFIAIAAGHNFSAAVDSDGTLYNWGGMVWNGSTWITSPHPTAVLPGTKFTNIDAGAYHSMGLTEDGTLFTWGTSQEGVLGRPYTSDGTPAPVMAGTRFAAVAAGTQHSMALTLDGALYVWGSSQYGAVGDGSVSDPVHLPNNIRPETTFAVIAAGGSHSMALTPDGTLHTWGSAASGVLGNDMTTGIVTTPTAVTSAPKFTHIAAGYSHSMALTPDGTLYTWGYAGGGALGNGTNTGDVTTPTAIMPGTKFTSIGAAGSRSMAATADGSLYLWGRDTDGVRITITPTKVPGLTLAPA